MRGGEGLDDPDGLLGMLNNRLAALVGAQVGLVVVGVPEGTTAFGADKLLLVEVDRHVVVEYLLPAERHFAHVTLELFGASVRLEVRQQAGVSCEVASRLANAASQVVSGGS